MSRPPARAVAPLRRGQVPTYATNATVSTPSSSSSSRSSSSASSSASPTSSSSSATNSASANHDTNNDEVDDYLSDSHIHAASRLTSTLIASTTKRARPTSPVLTPSPSPSGSIATSAISTDSSSTTKRARSDGVSVTNNIANQSMDARRTHGLATAISSDNVGYRLLAMMGYRDGMGIGKEGKEGRAEPVGLNIMNGRVGIGRDQHIERQKQHRQEIKHKYDTARVDNFRQHASSQFTYRRAQEDLKSCRAVCQTLDEKEGIKYNALWTPPEDQYDPLAVSSSDDDDDDKDNDKQKDDLRRNRALVPVVDTAADMEVTLNALKDLLHYLRDHHRYCFFCAIQFDDESDMKASCPGPYLSSHQDSGTCSGRVDDRDPVSSRSSRLKAAAGRGDLDDSGLTADWDD